MAKELPRTLGLVDALSIVVGIVIGGGIFLVPNLVARELASIPLIAAVWVFAGVISFFGALACAELGAAIPATGGQYVFIRESSGRMAAFLFGWANFVAARTAQVAWLGVTFSLYVSHFRPLSEWTAKALGIGVIAVLAAINYRGVTMSAAVQKLFALAKVAGLLVIIGGAFLTSGPWPAAPASAGFSFSHFGAALIAALLCYDGWVQLSFVAGEIRNPGRNMLLAMGLGVAAVMSIYVLTNLAYLRVMTIPEIAASDRVGADAAVRSLGPVGGTLVAAIILMSIVGTLNGCFLTSPRVYFAQARDGLFFGRFGTMHSHFLTPGFAILAQAVWAAVLVLTGTFETLVDYAMFAIWFFYALMIAAVIVLRVRKPGLERPYKMWGYPVTPAVFLLVAGWFLVNMLITKPVGSFAGLALIAAGVPVYYLWARRSAGPAAAAELESAGAGVDSSPV